MWRSAGQRVRRWSILGGASLASHVGAALCAVLLASPTYDHLKARADNPADDTLTVDLVRDPGDDVGLLPYATTPPAAEARPPSPIQGPPAPKIKIACAPRMAPPVTFAATPAPAAASEPAHEDDQLDTFDSLSPPPPPQPDRAHGWPEPQGEGGAPSIGGGVTAVADPPVVAAPAQVVPAERPPADQPDELPAAEASYLRTYETYPSLPHSLWKHGRTYAVLAQVCVSDQGAVNGVSIRDGSAPELENAIASSVRSWRYRPRMVEGQPRPFCHLMRFVYTTP